MSQTPAARPNHAIPARLNLALALGVLVTAVALLALAARLGFPWLLAVGLVYSFLLLTNYALLHEASHDLLHPDPRINDGVGMLLGWLFPVSFTLLKVTHIVHHCCNRTDHEMFDCYYPGDNRLVKTVQWYGVLTGLWWLLIPLGSLLLALRPDWLRSPPFRQARTTAVLFDDLGPDEMRRVRLEVLLGIGFWGLLSVALGLGWQALLTLYLCFAVNWSTRQYVTHAFSPRRVRDGAWNLRVSRPMGWLLLNGQWDRVHHQHPHVSWLGLPRLAAGLAYDRGYWRQYLSLWGGPRPCREPGPRPLSRRGYRELV